MYVRMYVQQARKRTGEGGGETFSPLFLVLELIRFRCSVISIDYILGIASGQTHPFAPLPKKYGQKI